MSRKCDVSGKKYQRGMRYSFLRAHFNPTAKRRFEVNLQTVRTKINGKPVKIKVAASVLKTFPEIRTGLLLPLKKGKSRRKIKKLMKA